MTENKEKKRDSVIGSIVWKLFERMASLIVSFAVTMVLSRILNPDDFGVVAIVAAFVNFLTVFVTSGLGNALIQKENADKLDFSTLFWANIVFSIGLYGLLFIFSPFIAVYFHHEELTWLIRVQSITILIYGINSIQTAYISRNMLFRFYFFSTLTGKAASGVLGIIFALWGGGAWALVIQSISLAAFETLVLWFKGGWRPEWVFSGKRAKELYSYSWKVMSTSLLTQFNDQLRNLIIGRKYSSEDIAYFDKGWLIPNTMVTNSINAMSAVMFPVLSRTQEHLEEVRSKMRQWISLYAFLIIPVLAFTAINARDITIIAFSEKWIPSVPFLVMACFVYGTRCVEVPIREAFKAIGRVDIVLIMQIMKMLISIVSLIFIMNFGVYAIGLNAMVCAVINIVISMCFGRKIIGYKFGMAVKDILPTILNCIVPLIIVLLINKMEVNIYLRIILQLIIGAMLYFMFAFIFKNSNFEFCINVILTRLKKKGTS